jgi:hypothetical protein
MACSTLQCALDAIQLADQLDAHPSAPPVLRLHHRSLPAQGQDEVDAAVGHVPGAPLLDAIAVAAEGVGNHLFELLRAPRGRRAPAVVAGAGLA